MEQQPMDMGDLAEELNRRGERVIFLGDGVPAYREMIQEMVKVPFEFAPAQMNQMCIRDRTGPSIEREIRSEITEKAEDGAIRVFGKNLEQLLMQPPITGRVVLGWDPAFRTGCKLAVVDSTGTVSYTHLALEGPAFYCI